MLKKEIFGASVRGWLVAIVTAIIAIGLIYAECNGGFLQDVYHAVGSGIILIAGVACMAACLHGMAQCTDMIWDSDEEIIDRINR